MRHSPAVLMTIALAALAPGSMLAQQSVAADSVRGHIRQTLRAFYFNLAHGDWEALTADILAAKVVAHRAPPADLQSTSPNSTICAGPRGPQIGQSTITLAGEWAAVFVPHCGVTMASGDEFRMVHFEHRWRFVAIDLLEDPLNLSTGP